ncbi:hypothetical protein [Methanospirillum hungatei]|uniref:hypothetical protein n=1 Tax=Methanospirillum hungatei TaxID=2203 RepID=UPI0026EDCD6A|nr:hypothetical protein [Methanospirillum hungatei]MCA1916097.1 hypothetical protein [Methanospirillum hungatei]
MRTGLLPVPEKNVQYRETTLTLYRSENLIQYGCFNRFGELIVLSSGDEMTLAILTQR